MKYILFDIDGTILDSGGAGTRAMNSAFEELFSVRDAFSGISMAGKTDLQIVREGLMAHGLDHSNGVVPAFFDLYVSRLRENIKEGKGHLKPGIREALEGLHSRGRCILGLLTGNIEQGAMIKLEHFGLGAYFFTGAFGSDDEDRNRLLPVAVEKLRRQRSLQIGFGDCIVIGDTPRDVDCAKPFGALSIGVATGPYSAGALRDAGADVVFQDLSETDRLFAVLDCF